MSFAETAALGAIAGLTIYVGLPLGRMQSVGVRLRVGLAMFSVGILAFIFMDVTSNAQEIVSSALSSFKDHHDSFAHVLGLFVLLALGFTAGVAGISAIERRLRGRALPPPIAGGATSEAAVAPAGLAAPDLPADDARRRALHTGMVIAIAIGLHNFAEGLAIGVSAKTGAIGLAAVCSSSASACTTPPRASASSDRSAPCVPRGSGWGFPGSSPGDPRSSAPSSATKSTPARSSLLFYALAGGAVLYVIGEIWTAMRRYGHRTLGLYMLSLGFLVGVATDLVVTYGGA